MKAELKFHEEPKELGEIASLEPDEVFDTYAFGTAKAFDTKLDRGFVWIYFNSGIELRIPSSQFVDMRFHLDESETKEGFLERAAGQGVAISTESEYKRKRLLDPGLSSMDANDTKTWGFRVR